MQWPIMINTLTMVITASCPEANLCKKQIHENMSNATVNTSVFSKTMKFEP